MGARVGHPGEAGLAELDRLAAEDAYFDAGSARALLDAFSEHLLADRRRAWGERMPVLLGAFGVSANERTASEVWRHTASWMHTRLTGSPHEYFDGSGADGEGCCSCHRPGARMPVACPA